MRQPLIAGNWKMLKTVRESVAFVTELRERVRGVDRRGRGRRARRSRRSTRWRAAATGRRSGWRRRTSTGSGRARSPARSAPRWCARPAPDGSSIGHSERRTLFGETDESVNRKVRAALAATLTPIVCIGETLQEREANETLAVLDRQIKAGLDGVTGERARGAWSWPTSRCGRSARVARPPRSRRRKCTRTSARASRSGSAPDAASRCRVLYGGSVKADNTAALMAKPDVDGALVGGASLDADSFVKIVERSRG